MPDLYRHYDKAEKLFQKGKLAAALEAYEGALAEDPRDERARESAAELCLSLNQNHRAAELLESLFRDYVANGNTAKSAPTFKKLLRLGKPMLDVVMEYGELIEPTSKKDAVEAYEIAIKNLPPHQGLAAIGRIVLLDPKPENYRRQGELASAAGEHEFSASAYIRFAHELERANFDSAEAYAKAYAEDPRNSVACLGHGRALVAQNRPQEAVALLEPLAKEKGSTFEAREPYAKALLALGRNLEAEPYVWELFEHDPKQYGSAVGEVVGALLKHGRSEDALALARKLDDFQRRAGKRRDFVQQMSEVAAKYKGNILFLEYLAELYDGSNREAEYCSTLGMLFDLYYASGNFIKAYDSLERAVDVDSYEAGHHERLARLKGRIDPTRLGAVSAKLGVIAMPETSESSSGIASIDEQDAPAGDGSTVLEDLVLQAEIFLQYSMRNKALEKIERIYKLFPREEQTNYRVRELYNNAGFVARYADPAPPPQVSAAATTPAPIRGADAPDAIVAEDLARAAEVNRNIARQANVKSVLFAAVNDVGRNWNSSRCIAGICAPGKPPSAVVEYCAPGVKQCDVASIVKLVMGMQPICAEAGVAVAFSSVQGQPQLQPLAEVLSTHGITSLLAIPMLDGDQQVGIVVIAQTGTARNWRQSEIAVLRTIADQMVLAINNARLRSLVKTLAVTDEKSGLLKRSSYIDVLLSEVRRAAQQNASLTLILMQIGKPSLAREIGEAALENLMQQVGQLIVTHIRQNDVALRYSATKVALLLSDTDEKSSVLAVEKLRRVLSVVRLPDDDKRPDVSAGIAEIIPVPEFEVVDIVTEAINRVEQALSLARTGAKTGVLALPPLPVTAVS
jgi:diguanylate cyclase (GGDEF)-like protein